MSPHSEDGALLGNHPQSSRAIPVSPKHGGRTVSATPVWRTSLQCIATSFFRKREGHVAGVRRTRKRVAPVRRTGCTLQLSWMRTAHLKSCLSAKASTLVNFTAYLVGRFRGPADRHPTPTPRGASGDLVEKSATLTAPRPGLGTGAARHLLPLFAYTMRINLGPP